MNCIYCIFRFDFTIYYKLNLITFNIKLDQGNKSTLLQYLLLGLWLLFNLIQAYFTELAHDEAYYWVYSENLDFGYFDHPPMVALLIKWGYAIFNNELGVRLFIIILSTGTIFLLHQLTESKNFRLLFAIICSIAAFQVYSIIAVPDAPLLFFTAAFFLCYKKYLQEDSITSIMLLAFSAVLLLYSKYHGILILFFTLISNFSLFRRKSFYLIIIAIIVLYLPHLLWQISNDYPSYQYHVLNKSQVPYNLVHTLEYLLGQILISGPIIGGLLIYASIRFKGLNGLDRALKFNLIGFFLFFLFSTLNAKVEANWTVAALIPLTVLAHQYLLQNKQLLHWVNRLVLFSIVLFVLIRIHLIFNLLPASLNVKAEFHAWKNWAKEIQLKAQDRPVLFVNSYQMASKYFFYSGQKAMSLNNIWYRRNQYDLWDIEESLQGENVLLVSNWQLGPLDTFATSKGTFYTMTIDNFRSYNKIFVDLKSNALKFAPDTKVQLPILLKNNYEEALQFGLNEEYPVSLVYEIFKFEDFIKEEKIIDLNEMIINDSVELELELQTPKEEGIYYLRISLKSGWLPATLNSHLIQMKISR